MCVFWQRQMNGCRQHFLVRRRVRSGLSSILSRRLSRASSPSPHYVHSWKKSNIFCRSVWTWLRLKHLSVFHDIPLNKYASCSRECGFSITNLGLLIQLFSPEDLFCKQSRAVEVQFLKKNTQKTTTSNIQLNLCSISRSLALSLNALFLSLCAHGRTNACQAMAALSDAIVR